MAQLKTPNQRDHVLSRIAVREATRDDITSVSAIDLNLHGGLDQLPALYLRQLSDPNRRSCVCELDGRVIGFQVAFVVDDGCTVILQSMRLHPDFRSLGIWTEVGCQFSGLLRDFTKLQRQAHTSAYLRTRSRGQRDLVHIMSRPAIQIRPSPADIGRLTSSPLHDVPNGNQVQELPKHDLHCILSSKINQSRLFPDNRLVLSWQPFRLLSSNFKIISTCCTDIIYVTQFGQNKNDQFNCSSMSFGRALQVPSGLRYDLDYYGSDVTDAYRHVCCHLRRCAQYHQRGDVNIEVFVPAGFDEVSIYAGALFIQLSLGWNLYLSIVILLSVTCIYTVLGGLAAVIYTDTAQTVIMTIGAVILAIISLNKVGGYESLQHEYFESYKTSSLNSSSVSSSINSTLWTPATNDINKTSCGAPPSDAFHIFRDAVTSDSPWLGLLLQSTLGCLWYWCADQVIVQRTLAARNLTHAKGGAILAGYLKILPLFLMIFPGMISRALYPDEVGCTDPIQCEKVCGNPVGCTNIAYPKLVMTLLPVGLRGLLLAAMMSAIMSSLTSIFNSASTLFTMDLWRRARPRATQRELLIVGRLCILVLCIVSVLWVPLLQTSAGGQLFVYIQAVQGYLGTPIGALFLLAIFWTRMNEQGAFWGILVGHACGMTRLILDMTYPAPACGMPDNRPGVISKLHYSYFGQINLLLTTAVCVIVSLLTAPLPKERTEGVTWWTRLRGEETPDEERQEEKEREMETANVDKENNEAEELINGKNMDEDQDPKSKMAVVEVVTTKQQTLMKRWVKFLCGIPEAQVGVMDTVATRRRLLYEQPKWRTFVNMNACLGLIVIAFLLGYYH